MDHNQVMNPDRCSMCGGNGQEDQIKVFFTVQQTCPQCSGSGEMITNPCGTCKDKEKNKHQKKYLLLFQKVLMMVQELD